MDCLNYKLSTLIKKSTNEINFLFIYVNINSNNNYEH